MTVPSDLNDIVSQLRAHAGVETVFGDPVVAEGRTVVPVACVRYGFGGGYGRAEDATGTSDEVVAEPDDLERGEGGGFGGGVVATPVGVVELSPGGTRFVPTTARRQLLTGLGVGAVVGFLLGRRRRDRA